MYCKCRNQGVYIPDVAIIIISVSDGVSDVWISASGRNSVVMVTGSEKSMEELKDPDSDSGVFTRETLGDIFYLSR